VRPGTSAAAARSPIGRVILVEKLCCPSVPYLALSLPRSDIVPGTDKALPENSQQNLNKKLDGAVEETFPSSDPVSVSITKGGAIEYDHDDDEAETLSTTPSKSGQQGTSESLLTQTKEKLSDVGSTVSKAAHEAYTEGSRYVGGAVGDGAVLPAKHGSSPTAGFRQPAVDTPRRPWAGLVAWMIHRTAYGGARGIPDYARTRRVYTPYRED
jgi:hypothetical protein